MTAEGVKKMSKYVKPVISLDEGMAEGVYAASGCYTVNAYIHQTPEVGREDYRIQVNGQHHATHTNDVQTLTLVFNQSVTYVSSQGKCIGSKTGTTIVIQYTYHNNENDKIGLGDVIVTSGAGLAITGATLTDDK